MTARGLDHDARLLGRGAQLVGELVEEEWDAFDLVFRRARRRSCGDVESRSLEDGGSMGDEKLVEQG